MSTAPFNTRWPGHGIDEILDVVSQLSAVDIPSCMVGVRALRYYGAGRVIDEWDLCVPDEKLEAARVHLLSEGHGTKYEVASPRTPVPWSLRHTFPCLRLKGSRFEVILVPSSDCAVDPANPDNIERSLKGVPYASLVPFARSLLLLQMGADIADLIDGMDLTLDWGRENLDMDALQAESKEFVATRNRRAVTANQNCHGDVNPGCGMLSPKVTPKELWRKFASSETKELRIEPMKKGRYFTRWRSFRYPEDPRTKDRPV